MVAVAGGLLAAPLAAKGAASGKGLWIEILGNIPTTVPEGARLWGALIQEVWGPADRMFM